jgi:MFS family permease
VLFGATAGLVLLATMTLREPHRQEIGDAQGGGLRELWGYRIFLLPLLAAMMFEGGATAVQWTWTAPLLTRIYHQQPADFTIWLGPVTLLCGLLGVAAGTLLSNFAQRNGGQRRMLSLATIASLAAVPAVFYSLMPTVTGLAALFAIVSTASFVVIVVAVIVINLHIPNELRGMVLALQVVTAGLSGALSPGLVALVSRGLGGDMMLGQAMVLVAVPCWLAAAGCYGLARRASQAGRDQDR